jgi:ferritin-like metal-binding protein YciE
MTLHEELIDELKDLYHAEKQLTKALPKMAKAASNDDLREGFEMHLEETEEQIARLEHVFEALGEKAKPKFCPGMAGIVEEGSEKLKEGTRGAVLDAVLIASAQRVEHYEIGAYGTCVEWARLMGHNEVVALLEASLEEEKATDKKLTMLAESHINQEALGEGADEEGEEDEETAGPARGSQSGRRTQSANRRQSGGNARTRAKAADRRRR